MVVEIKDKVFFVTGAASGIGAETVKILVRENAKVSDFEYILLIHILKLRGGR